VTAADGYTLAATRYAVPTAGSSGGPRRAHLVVAGATGVPQGFYRRFAEHAATRGFETLTVDYRGIGRSAPASLRGFHVDYRDWARQDLAAVVDRARRAAASDRVPLVLVGHSYGGHALGLMPDPGAVAAAYFFATGAGWAGWMTPAERAKVRLMWGAVGPAVVRCRGYLAWSLLGMGEDLPLGVYRQWRRWCGYPRYFFDDPEVADEVSALFARVRLPVRAANATDDAWAPPRSRDAFMGAGYVNAPWDGVDVEPVLYGGRVGHMGYFRPAAAALWDDALDWLAARAGSREA
jgi:predicted alpha/beta hydrolase